MKCLKCLKCLKQLTLEQKQKIVEYHRNHSTNQTLEKFKRWNLKRQTLLKYARRYNGTKESLIDRRTLEKHPNRLSPTEDEIAVVLESLLVENSDKRRRNVLEPTYYRMYMIHPELKGKRSRAGLRKIANTLIGLCKRGLHKSTRLVAHDNKYHSEFGFGQIDKMYVPVSSLSDNMKSQERLNALRTDMKQEASKNLMLTLQCYDDLLAETPSAPINISLLKRDAISDYEAYCASVEGIKDDDLLQHLFYQYTFVDTKTRWTFRMMFDTQSELAALRFVTEVIRHAPFPIKHIQTDNGVEFTSKYLNNHEGRDTPFESFLKAQKIQYYRIQPGKPWQNGRVECQHRLDKERFYGHLVMESLEDGEMQLEQYNEESNHWAKRCLDGVSPLNAVMQYA